MTESDSPEVPKHSLAPLIGLTLLAAVLILVRLDTTLLWQDEAETAVLGYNTLQHGYPTVVDEYGNTVLKGGHEYNADGVWTWQTWGQYYVAAGSFALLGKTTLAARLPFALFGIACIPMTYLLGLRLYRRPQIALLGATFLTFSVPFILFSRQCRNYTMATLATLLILLAYRRFLARESRWGIGLAAALVFLYYSQVLIFFGVGAGLAAHYLIFRHRKEDVVRCLPALGIVFAFTFPWFLYSGGFDRPGQWAPEAFIPNLLQFLIWINNYIFPFLLLIVLAAILYRGRRSREGRRLFVEQNPAMLILIGVGVALLLWSFVFWVFFRYLVVFLPLLLIGLAATVDQIWTRHSLAGLGLTLLLIASNLLSVAPMVPLQPLMSRGPQFVINRWGLEGQERDRYRALRGSGTRRTRPESLLLQYVGEMTRGYRGPMDEILHHLKDRIQPGDRIWTNYECLPLLFYNNPKKPWKVYSYYEAAIDTERALIYDADWLIVRDVHDWVLIKGKPYRTDTSPQVTQKLIPLVTGKQKVFSKMTLTKHDRKGENRPDPDDHSFEPSPTRGKVIIYRRIRPD